jgi:hypothetical protein
VASFSRLKGKVRGAAFKATIAQAMIALSDFTLENGAASHCGRAAILAKEVSGRYLFATLV